MEQVDTFKYLGTIIENTGKSRLKVNIRVDAVLKVYHAL